jgi:hypothetical protein
MTATSRGVFIMRVLGAIAILVLGIAAAGVAHAADMRVGHGRFVAHYDPLGRPAGQILLYDWEPGVVVRAYWLPPARNHHYFPFGRDRWDIHPAHARWVRPRPAQSFYRYWSTSSGFDAPPPRYWAPPRPPYVAK